MCGINGITRSDEGTLEKMMKITAHRGPDGSGKYIDEGISLGHNRLAVIDLSENGTQPMWTSDMRYVITYNGEIYNYRELREELASSYKFRTESDTEVLLAAYSVWAEDMFPKLKGIFAFAIWDTKEKSLILARDHMGVKPLYYTFEDEVLTFSSELTALTQVNGGIIDTHAVSLFLELTYVPNPHTMVHGVKKVSPGHYIKWKAGEVENHSYFDTFRGDGVPPEGSSIYQTIDNAVHRQLVSDRPVGVFLSGGLDSSIVLHHMSEHIDSVRSFSVDFEMVKGAESESEKFNTDAALAERTAAAYGATHTKFPISINDVRESLENIYQLMDEPNANPTGVSQYLLSKWVREDGVVVALGGDGGDELFGGYTRHRAIMAAYLYQRLPLWFQQFGHRLHPRALKLSQQFQTPIHTGLMAIDEEDIDKITNERLGSMDITKAYFDSLYREKPEGMHPLDVFMRVDRRTWLPDESLARSDRSSMAHGLELRVPLLDTDVVRLSDTISPYRKMDSWRAKKILRASYRKHLPDYLFRQPKRGWISPGAKWFRDPVIHSFAMEVFSSSYYNGLDPIFNWDAVRTMLDDHVEKRRYYREPLWNLLVLQIWAKRVGVTSNNVRKHD